MQLTARGTFDVKLTPQPLAHGEDPARGRMALDKQFQGDLEATSQGEMLTGGVFSTGSAGYVAIEHVQGTLGGRRGAFVLQHNGTMNRGQPSLTVSVVPDTGTGELQGLAGTMEVIIEGKAHSYVFDYTLPDGPDGAGG